MKKIVLLMLIAFLLVCSAQAQTAKEYAAWLEEALPEYQYSDAAVPGFITDALGTDYDFAARFHEEDGLYIAGVRRDSAPQLPLDIHTSYDGTFETRMFRAEDASGHVYYEFVLADGVYMQAYDGMQRLIIYIDPKADAISEFQKMFYTPQSLILNAADPQYRAQLAYAGKMGFTSRNEGRSQLLIYIHNIETWHAGATWQPSEFYLDVTPPEDLLGESYLDEDTLIQHTRIPIGLYLKDGNNEYELVLSEGGIPGVETHNPHRLYTAGPGYETLINLAEDVLGYRPGKVDFTGKTSIRATLEWRDGSITIDDEGDLRRLDAMFCNADYSVGSVNCPSPCFLTLDYADGSSISMAVAINSFDLFFFNGMYFTAGDGELLDIFNLNMEDFYV